MKKTSIVLTLLVLCLTLSQLASASQIELTWVVWDDPEMYGHRQITELFMEKHPDIKVEIMYVPFDRYEDKVRTLLAAGDPPDVIYLNDDYVNAYTKRNALLPLTRFVEASGYQRDEMYERLWDFPWVDGEMMAMIPNSKVRCFVYNVDAFKDAGLPMLTTKWEDPTWNWDTMLDYAQKLTARDAAGRTTQYGVAAYHDTGCELMWPVNNGGEGVFSQDGLEFTGARPEETEAFQFLADLTNKWHVQPTKGGLRQISANDLFLTGQLAMMQGGSGSLAVLRGGDLSFEWDMAPMPMQKRSIQEGSLVCHGIPRGANNPEASWKFLDFLMSEEALTVWAELGFAIPIRKSVADAYIRPELPPKNQQVIVDAMDYHRSHVYTEHTQRARQIFRSALELVWNGEETAAEAMNNAKDEIERALRGEY